MSTNVHSLVQQAKASGAIAKPAACEVCECRGGTLVGHHDDYARPLDVRWLCPSCHYCWHANYGPAANRHLIDTTLSVSMSRDLRDRLEERAQAEQRTASQHVRWLIQRDSEKEAA